MKKYAIILLVLILIGLALAVSVFTQEQRLDPTVFLQTTKSIRNLQALDKNLSLLLNQSRYNSDFDHIQLLGTNDQISEEFDNLRFEALFEEIEGSPGLSEAVAKFEEQFALRKEALDTYIEGNKIIVESLVTINQTTQELQTTELEEQTMDIQPILGNINAGIYSLAVGGDLDSASINHESGGILDQLSQIQSTAPKTISPTLATYKSAVNNIITNHQSTKTQFTQLQNLMTGLLLDSIENEYTLYHNQGISGSNQFRNALIIYGFCLLGALIFFGFSIRKNYLSLEQQVADRTAEIKTTYDDLQESQEQLIQSEKMASLGQMVAGVAHEINTPLGYVNSNIDTLRLNLADLNLVIDSLGDIVAATISKGKNNHELTELLISTLKTYHEIEATEIMSESQQLISDGAYGLSEISKLVMSLKDFARLDRQNAEQMDLQECLNSSLIIASNHIRENNVTVEKSFSTLPKVECFPSKLNQLFLNIITNACQAMSENGGKLTVATIHHDDDVRVIFQDEGIGMDKETQQKMFDPFFTTKEIGEGTGLGMSIAYKIIELHQGSIDVQSSSGVGSTVTITLPAITTTA